MPNLTPNYGLKMPIDNENADISIINENMQTIDTTLAGKGDMQKSTYDTNNNGVVDKAEKLNTARTITLSGAITGSVSFDGSGNVIITTTLAALSAALVTSGTMSPARILEDASNRFVTDSEKSAWNGKANTLIFTTTIQTGSWSGSVPWYKSISVAGILSTDNPIIDVVLSSTSETAKLQLEAWGKVNRIVTSDNAITVYCYDELPVTAIPIQIKVVR